MSGASDSGVRNFQSFSATTTAGMLSHGLCPAGFSPDAREGDSFHTLSAAVTIDSFDLAHEDAPLHDYSSRSLWPQTPISLVAFHVGFTKDVADLHEYMSDPGGTTGVMDEERGICLRLKSFGACRTAGVSPDAANDRS